MFFRFLCNTELDTTIHDGVHDVLIIGEKFSQNLNFDGRYFRESFERGRRGKGTKIREQHSLRKPKKRGRNQSREKRFLSVSFF